MYKRQVVRRLCASAGNECRKATRRVGSSAPKTSAIRWMGVCPVSSAVSYTHLTARTNALSYAARLVATSIAETLTNG